MRLIKLFTAFLLMFSNTILSQHNQIQKGTFLILVDAFPSLPNFVKPLYLTHANNSSGIVYVVEQMGRIWSINTHNNPPTRKLFLDITDRVNSLGVEEGLLSVAFHPQFKVNKFFYINYIAANPRRTIISRFSLSQADSTIADTSTEFKILEIDQPYSNHNGGLNLFGPDGYLYIGTGDGGSGGDPQNNAQNLTSLLGKILRINVDSSAPPINYSIPSDNPFKGNTQGYCEEIWAWGLRNPWRFSFDSITNLLYCADVGQNEREEINIIQKGKNYGWRCYEGNIPYNLSGCGPKSLYTFPIKDYNHSVGASIIGGFVYRGNMNSSLVGAYIYGDYVSGRIWMLRYDGLNVTEDSLLLESNYNIASFGEDEQRELYICAYNGRIYRIQSQSTDFKDDAQNDFSFKLYQNFPNPFSTKNRSSSDGNLNTVITYELRVPSVVSLKVYDLFGREVATLVDEVKETGMHSVTLDTRNTLQVTLPSGVYFYQLCVKNPSFNSRQVFIATKKMIILK